MMRCEICGCETYTNTIPICPDCSRTEKALSYVSMIHEGFGKIRGEGKFKCKICSNECGFEDFGLCRLRVVRDGKLVSLTSSRKAVLYAYEDPLPTNCCNAWFCKGSKLKGTNLAVFYYGCNFDCLFCQNWSHKNVREGRVVSVDEMVERAMNERVKCVCHFGGSPEPQLPFAIRFSEEILKNRDVMICWEWNGAGRESLALKASKLSYESEGTVKFDLKAWNPYLHMILTGRNNEKTLKNFEKIFDRYPEVLSATTLLVPYYVDEREVEGIAKFLADLSDDIPYSLLIFHPDYRLSDLPITPRSQVEKCYRVARKYLKRVNIGNKFLLAYAPP